MTKRNCLHFNQQAQGFIEQDVEFNPVLTNFNGLPSLSRYRVPRGTQTRGLTKKLVEQGCTYP